MADQPSQLSSIFSFSQLQFQFEFFTRHNSNFLNISSYPSFQARAILQSRVLFLIGLANDKRDFSSSSIKRVSAIFSRPPGVSVPVVVPFRAVPVSILKDRSYLPLRVPVFLNSCKSNISPGLTRGTNTF